MKYNPKIVLAYFEECGLPRPELEYKFHPERKWRFDFAFLDWAVSDGVRVAPIPSSSLALECEGGLWTGGAHGRGSGIVRDIEKYNEAAALGWRVIRVQPRDLCTLATVNLIKRCLGL